MTTDAVPTEDTGKDALDFHRTVRWLSAALALLLVVGLACVVVAVWLPIQTTLDRAVERYFPLRAGTTLYYQLANPDGTEQFQTMNVGRLSGNDGLLVLPTQTRADTITYLTGTSSDDFSEEDYNDFLALANREVHLARVIETTASTTATVSTVSSYYLVQDHRISLMAIDTQGFNPFIPYYDDQMAIGDSLMVTGTYGISNPYSATLTYEGDEDLDTEIGSFKGCRKVRLVLDIPEVTRNTLVSSLCEGIGIVYQETTVNDNPPIVSTLRAAHTPTFNAGTAQTAPLDIEQPALTGNAVSPLNPDIAWQTAWSYRNNAQQADLSTSVVATRDFLLVGTKAGDLFALNRNDHTLAWRFQTGESVYAAPAVADGVVYIASRDGTLYAVDLANGAYRWSFPTNDALNATPTVADGIVYFGSEDHFIYAVGTDGKERWHYETAGAVAARPIVRDGTLYVGSDDGALYALDSQSGVTRWVFPTEAAVGEAVAVTDDLVIVGSYSGDVYALKRNTTVPEGEVVWSFRDPVADSIAFGIQVVDQQVIVASTQTLFTLDLNTGVLGWKYDSGDSMRGSPIVTGDFLVENLGQRLIVLNRTTGELVRTIPTGNPDAYSAVTTDGEELFLAHTDGFLRVMANADMLPWESTVAWNAYDLTNDLFAATDDLGSPPIRYQDDLVFVTTFGKVVRVNRTDGRHLTLGDVPIAAAYMPPSVQGDVLLTGSQTGELALFNLQTHKVLWRKDLERPTYYPAQFAGDRVLWATSEDATMTAYAFDATSGEVLWQKDLPFAFGVSNGAVLYQGIYYVAGDVLSALDPQTGDVLWQTTDDLSPLHVVPMGDTIYVMGLTSDYQTVIAGWNIATHERTTWIPYSSDALPVFLGEGFSAGDGYLFLVMSDNTLSAFSIAEQKLAWNVKNGFSVLGAPRVHAGKVWYVATNNHLYARTISDGTFAGDFAIQTISVTQTDGTMAPLFDEGMVYVGFYESAIALPLREDP